MTRQHLLQSIAVTIGDYRQGEIPAPDADHVGRWICQFAAPVQEAMLAEMDHVLKQSYLSRDCFLSFLQGIARTGRLSGWHGVWQMWRSALNRLIGTAIHAQGASKVYSAFWRDIQLLEGYRFISKER